MPPHIKMDSILVWNVKGANHKNKRNGLSNFILRQRASVVSFLETKVKQPNLGNFYLNVFQGWCFTANGTNAMSNRIVVLRIVFLDVVLRI